jgi:hypothetical protein
MSAEATREVIGTRVNVAGWSPLLGPSLANWDRAPTGNWELALSSQPAIRDALRSGAIHELALILSFRADFPAWLA